MASTSDSFRMTAGGGPLSGAHHATELDPHDLVRILRRRKFVVLGTLAFVLLAIAVYLLRTTPLYTASTTLEVATYSAEASTQGEPMPLSPQDEIRIATHIELLNAPALGAAVAKDLELEKDPEFMPPEDIGLSADADPEELEEARIAAVVDKLFDRIDIERVGQSALIRISATTDDAEKSAYIANALAGTHRKNLLKQRKSSTSKEIESLTQRAGELRAEAIEGEREAVEQGQQAGLPAGAGYMATGQVERLSAQLSEARAQRAAAETRYGQMGGIGGSMSGAGASPLLSDLRAQQAMLDKRVAELSAQFGPGHPDMRAAEAQRTEIAARLADEMIRARREASAEVAAARAREGQIAADLGAARSREMRAGAVSVGVSDLQRSAATNRELYLAQLSRLQELRGREQSMRAEASVAVKAIPPMDPSSPNVPRLLVAGFAGGLILGIILAFIVEVFDRKLRTAEQLKRLLGLETLALIPELSLEDADLSPAELLRRDPTSIYSESIRSMFLDLVGQVRGSGRCIVVTSPLPKEGKTTLSVSLAAAAAMLGRKAIVVDLDLRRPAVSSLLKVAPSEPDLTALLTGEGPLDTELALQAIQTDPTLDKLSILSVARLPEDPGDLLASPRVQDLIDMLRRRFDFIVLNAPPILPVRDAKHLATLADATLLVIRWGKTDPDAAVAAQKILGRWTTAAVINRVDYKQHAASQYGDRLQHYAAYQSYFGVGRESAQP